MGHEEQADRDDFKMSASGQEPTGETPSGGRNGQPPATNAAPQARNQGAKGGVFKTPPWVIQALVENQRDAEWWANRDDLEMLRNWGHILIKAFNLRVKDATYQGMPLIRIERMNVRTLGMYRAEADGYAIVGTIVLNEERLRDLPVFMKLTLLPKLLLCAWQHQRGGDGTFDPECRERMKDMGLLITKKGSIRIDEDGAFRRLLESYGIEVPVASLFPPPARKGKTTLQLWSCMCQSCRVGKKVFSVVCSECHEPFRLGDHVGKRFV
jgi:hypothetical protein